MSWTLVGRATITASDFTVDVGTVTLPASGALEVRVKQISPAETSVFRSGLLYVRTTTGGRELGTKRFWGHLEGEDYVLGSAGQVDMVGEGVLILEPRAINLKALKSPSLSPWVLDVWVRPLALATGDGGDGGGGTTPTPTPTPSNQTAVITAVEQGTGRIFSNGTITAGAAHANYPLSLAFDSSLDTFFASAAGEICTVEISPPFPIKETLELKTYIGAAGEEVRINGVVVGTWGTYPGGKRFTLTQFTELASVTVTYLGHEQSALYALWADGVQLIDARPLTRLTFADTTGFSSLAPGVALREAGNGDDGLGVVASFSAAAKTVDFTRVEGGWSVGSKANILSVRDAMPLRR
jgi:hypothetical protein